MRAVKRVALTCLNCIICTAAFLLLNRLVGAVALEVVVIALFYLMIGAALQLWSSRWWMTVVPAIGGYLIGLGALKWAIHLTDTRGEFAPPMMSYIFNPSAAELLVTSVVGGASATGWWLSSRLSRGLRSG